MSTPVSLINIPIHGIYPRSFRNYIAHAYFGINPSQVFKTVTDLLPGFKVLTDRMIEQEKK